MTVHLIAVQAELNLAHYRTPERFSAWILELCEQAVAGLGDAPKLVAFPELIGMPLLLTLEHDVTGCLTLSEAAARLLRREWRGVLRAALRYRAFGAQAFFLSQALPAYRAYVGAFSHAARQTGATVVAGSSFLPEVSGEAARGLHITNPRIQNASYTFAPTGSLLGVTGKRFLTAGLESRVGLRGASAPRSVVATPAGRVGVAICLDGFYSAVIDQLDGLGAEIVVQPSANFAPWSRRWPPDASYSEGEAWLGLGLRQGVRGRQSIRYGVNPMLVGSCFGLAAQGRSSVVANPRFLEAETEAFGGVVALAARADEADIVRAEVTLTGAPVG